MERNYVIVTLCKAAPILKAVANNASSGDRLTQPQLDLPLAKNA